MGKTNNGGLNVYSSECEKRENNKRHSTKETGYSKCETNEEEVRTALAGSAPPVVLPAGREAEEPEGQNRKTT